MNWSPLYLPLVTVQAPLIRWESCETPYQRHNLTLLHFCGISVETMNGKGVKPPVNAWSRHCQFDTTETKGLCYLYY